MARISTRATVVVKAEIKLAPKLEKRLRAELAEYTELNLAYQRAKEERDAKIADIEELREKVGEKSFKIDGASITRVEGTSKSLDKKKLVELGCAMAWIEEATTERPKKAHTRVTLPGEKTYGGSEE